MLFPNFLAISVVIPHIGAIVTGAWVLEGFRWRQNVVTDFSSYPQR
jgi:hypothetical protein